MAPKGQGRRAHELLGFTAEQLGEFSNWLARRLDEFNKGQTAAAAEYRLTKTDQSRNHYAYWTNAISACVWIIHQLDYVITARAAQQQEAARVTSRSTGRRKQRPGGPSDRTGLQSS